MSMSFDLTRYLHAWPYDRENCIRIVRTADGREVLQIRQPLGIEQLEMTGRPDGLRPHGMDSAFDFQLRRFEQQRAAGKGDSFRLSPEECAELFEEGGLYYIRYVNLFQLKEWKLVIRDTGRNIRLFDFVRRHAETESDREHLEQWRPYILRINATARAMLALENDQHREAIQFVSDAIEAIENLSLDKNPTFEYERERSLTTLREFFEEIETTRPLSEMERLERDLQQAVERQEFEKAATIRDRIKRARQQTENHPT
jgi:hypothetical protein